MEESTSKEKVLKRIRKALINKSAEAAPNVDFESPIYAKNPETLEINFAQNFTEAGGKFVFCLDYNECIDNLLYLAKENNWDKLFCLEEPLKELLDIANLAHSEDLEGVNASITTCEFLIAQTGGVVVSSKLTSGRVTPFLFPVHLVLAFTSQLVEETKDAFKNLKLKFPNQLPSMLSIICGPGRTMAIDTMPLQVGIGPTEIYVFLIDDLIAE
ncbi:MAG TPA: LUD domain-containing protein [Bacteroidia bacterium]|nr:LUD domain-containing protein [Bacteroidia bacterium]HRH07458.1 LUD domain-containing protein [Bacteroidia bacterium]